MQQKLERTLLTGLSLHVLFCLHPKVKCHKYVVGVSCFRGVPLQTCPGQDFDTSSQTTKFPRQRQQHDEKQKWSTKDEVLYVLHRVLQGVVTLLHLFPSAPDPSFKASKLPFLTLTIAIMPPREGHPVKHRLRIRCL